MCTSYVQLSDEERNELMSIIEGFADSSFIRTLMYNKFGIVLNDSTSGTARKEFFNRTLEEIGIDPTSSSWDRLLAFYRCRPDISFISVTHSIQSGFVTMKKDASEKVIKDISEEVLKLNTDALQLEEIETWRNT
jgi:hypothetical protein